MKISKEQMDKFRDWLKTEEGMNHESLTFKQGDKKKVINHKCNADDKHDGGNCKLKFHKETKTDKGLKQIMSIISTKEKTNQALISELSASNN